MNPVETTQLFVVSAVSRSEGKPLSFLIHASSHRNAWAVARETCRTGEGAKVRDTYNVNLLHDYPLAAGQYTVKRVLSTSESRRGRPPKLLAADLLAAAANRNVQVPARVRRVIDELTKLH